MIQSIIKKGAVKVLGELSARADEAHGGHAPRQAKSVRALSQGGVVSALEITCACGETTIVELEYPKPTEAPR